jgi:hypothetical protein
MLDEAGELLGNKFDFVLSAGVAPTDAGGLACYQVELESALYLEDSYLNQVEEFLEDKCDSEMFGEDCELKVLGAKEILNEGSEDEECYFWVLVFGYHGIFDCVGKSYYMVYSDDRIVRGVQKESVGRDVSVGTSKFLRSDVRIRE